MRVLPFMVMADINHTGKKAGSQKKRRALAERRKIQRILYGRRLGQPAKYRPDHHPEDIVVYFRAALDAIDELERVESAHGGVKYVQAPVRPPTLAGYAAKIGVRRETLWAWTKKHTEFDEAVGICKAIQEHVLVTMGLLGAYRPNMTIFVLKNALGWKDRVEQRHTGAVVLRFDAQDAAA